MIADLAPGSLIVHVTVHPDYADHVLGGSVAEPDGHWYSPETLQHKTPYTSPRVGRGHALVDREFMAPRVRFDGACIAWGPADQEQHLLRLCRITLADHLDKSAEALRSDAAKLRELTSTETKE